jgi:Flp pilus assembly protein TadB
MRKIVAEEQAQSQQARKKSKISKEATEQIHGPSKSYWPFALAAALMIAFLGVVIHPILFVAGVVLTALAVIGWGLERR